MGKKAAAGRGLKDEEGHADVGAGAILGLSWCVPYVPGGMLGGVPVH